MGRRGTLSGTARAALSAFQPRTLVVTPEGERPIEQLQRGDQILARHEASVHGAVEAKIVEEVFVREGLIFELTVAGRLIRTTAEHPFYVKDGGWTPAGNLVSGVLLATLDGRWLPLESAPRRGTPRNRL